MPPRIVVVGSVNLDLVVRVERLPERGETVGGGSFSRVPGGKGANQAVACARLGADVTMIAAVGRDPQAEEALAGLRAAGVDLVLQESEAPTGVALIQVDAEGETTIAVAPGANATLGAVDLPPHDAVLCQLEIPDDAVLAAWEECSGLFCLNAAPASARCGRRGPHRRQPARARDARPQGRARRADTRCRGRRPAG